MTKNPIHVPHDTRITLSFDSQYHDIDGVCFSAIHKYTDYKPDDFDPVMTKDPHSSGRTVTGTIKITCTITGKNKSYLLGHMAVFPDDFISDLKKGYFNP